MYLTQQLTNALGLIGKTYTTFEIFIFKSTKLPYLGDKGLFGGKISWILVLGHQNQVQSAKRIFEQQD